MPVDIVHGRGRACAGGRDGLTAPPVT
jgi:hypothetical protein